MKKSHFQLDAYLMKGLAVLMLCGAWALTSCKDDNGLEEGDPNYFTSSRGQFTATLSDGTTLFLIPGGTAGTALVTFDGSNPLHWLSSNNTTIRVDTYQGNIVLPQTVTASNGGTYTIVGIGQEAFMGCRAHDNLTGLTGITLPSSVTSLGEGAFAYTSLTTLAATDLPTTITALPTGCFGYCQDLTTVTLPTSIQVVGKQAFSSCSTLATLTLNEGLTTIGERAFFGCSKLTTLTLPSTVTSIGKMAFYNSGMKTIDLSASGLTTLSEGLFTACKDLTSVTLPATLQTIGAKAFYDCRNDKFTSITIPASVTRIGDKAFGGRGPELNSSGTTTYWYSYITEYHVQSTTPPTLEGVLYEVNPDGSVVPTIYVPSGSVDAYKAAPGWSSLNIVGE